jgi:hypothetical protein
MPEVRRAVEKSVRKPKEESKTTSPDIIPDHHQT